MFAVAVAAEVGEAAATLTVAALSTRSYMYQNPEKIPTENRVKSNSRDKGHDLQLWESIREVKPIQFGDASKPIPVPHAVDRRSATVTRKRAANRFSN